MRRGTGKARVEAEACAERAASVRRLWLLVLMVTVVAASLALLSGCKHSDVLTQHLEDPELGTLDEGADPIYRIDPDGEERPDLADVSVGESDDVNTQVAILPHYDPNAPDNGPTTQYIKSEETPHDEEAAVGTEEGEADREGSFTSDEGGVPSGKDAEDADKKGGGKEKEEKEEEEEQEEEEESAETEGEEEDEGKTEEEPEDQPGDSDEPTEDPGDSGDNPDTDEPEDPNDEPPDNSDPTDPPDEKNPGETPPNDEDPGSTPPGDTLDEDDGNESKNPSDGGNGGDKVITDPDGENTDTAKGTVAAVGEYATIAQMLGGAGALAAADEDWMKECDDKGIFPDERDRVETAFTGDGTRDGSCDVDALVNTIKPSVVLWDSVDNVPALSSSERKTLEKNGITVQPVPHIGEQSTEDYDVKAAMTEVASVLSEASDLDYDAQDTLSKYCEFHDGVLTDCYESNKGYSYKVTDSSYKSLYQTNPLTGLGDSTTTRAITVYVDDWLKPSTSQSVVSQSGGGRQLAHDGEELDLSDGVGLSATSGADCYLLIDYYLQLAGVMNDAYDMDKPNSNNKRYILMPGIADTFSSSDLYAKRSTSSAFFFNAGDGTVEENWHALGDDDFDTVLVADEDIMNAIVKSAGKSDGLYNMENGYRVIVVPTGAEGPWTEGHVDSFLMALWSFRIQDESNLDIAEDTVKDFYETYFRCTDWERAVSDWDNSTTVD